MKLDENVLVKDKESDIDVKNNTMIRQECTYYPETYELKSYKEYYNDILILHTEYDENRNKVYMELSYPNEPVEWMKRKFKEGSHDDTGEVVWYENEKGIFKHIYYENGSKIIVKNSFDTITRIVFGKQRFETINITIYGDNYFLELKAVRNICENDCFYFTRKYDFTGPYKIEYNSSWFEEIYYEDEMNGKKIIHAELLYDLFPIKWLLDEYKIKLHSEKYRPKNWFCREYRPESRIRGIDRPKYL